MSRSPNTRLETTHTSLTMSDFDPEHEAFVSTRQIDQSDQLPELPSSFRKNQSPACQEPDYAIDTSTIERAFPEFSDIDSSGDNDDDDSEVSVEAGRGVKSQHRLDDSRNSILSAEENVRASSPAIRIDYPLTNGTSKSALRSSSRRMAGTDLRKDAQIRRASQVYKEHADSASGARTKGSSGSRAVDGARRTLSEMHAKVRDTYDGSYISDERPQAVTVNTRATRFSNVSAQVAAAVDQASRDAREKRTSRYVSAGGTLTASTLPENGTYQSFVLPDLPNLSDLVSGVYEDGAPVFNRQNKRSTRFVSPPPDGGDASQGHVPVEAVPIPEDEKVLFVSLKLMQEKVAALELAKTEAEKRLDELRQENHQLRTEKSRRQKEQYDRVKMFGGDEARVERLLQERTKLDAANMELQNRLDIAERKIQVHESTIKTLAQERDSAVSQLGIAYLHTQDVKAENDSLRRENADLKAQLAKLTALLQKLIGQDTDTRRSATGDWTTDGDTGDVTADSTHRSNDQSRSRERQATEGSRARISSQIDKVMAKIEKERQEAELFDLAKPSRSSQHKARSEERKSSSAGEKKQPNTGKQRVKRVIVEDVDVTDRVAEENPTEEVRSQAAEDKDVTFLSFMDEREIAQLRRRLEEELVARKQRQAKDITVNTTGNTTTGSRRLVSDPPRRSSLKEPKDKIARPSSALGEMTTTSRTEEQEVASEQDTTRRRRHSDHSTASRSRRRNPMSEMTSAIILPDITLHINGSEPTQSEPAQQTDNPTRHDGGNCTVCKRALDGTSHDHTHTDEKPDTVNIPKPIPVSERMPKPTPYQEDPTIRPAEPPGVALATVLKGLEDELSHLKMQLARYQTAYNKHDASLGKRRRKALARKIETLLREIDTKSDQIYALYDVLEGQKQSGQEMTEREIEVTLQSIGINVGQQRDLTDRTVGSAKRRASVQPRQQQQDEDEEDDDSELPWEGIESTGEVTGQIG